MQINHSLMDKIQNYSGKIMTVGFIAATTFYSSGCASIFPKEDPNRTMMISTPYGMRPVPNPLYGKSPMEIFLADEVETSGGDKSTKINSSNFH